MGQAGHELGDDVALDDVALGGEGEDSDLPGLNIAVLPVQNVVDELVVHIMVYPRNQSINALIFEVGVVESQKLLNIGRYAHYLVLPQTLAL